MKVASNILTKLDQLWFQVLHDKYNWAFGIPTTINRRNFSRLWQGLSKIWKDIKDGVYWNLSNGINVLFRQDPWIGTLGPLLNYVENPAMVSNVHSSVVGVAIVDARGNGIGLNSVVSYPRVWCFE
ncbi:hypothetical protein V6N11_010220 [Hibiscus sabdariffa]|uniref:Uncharacterized protein n=2 Tax=Hibiscus sabdariffa TaxID=183260 RepID=A0ABR2PE26_9ROSI